MTVLYVDNDLGRIYAPARWNDLISLPNRATRRRVQSGEEGLFVAKQKTPIYCDGVLWKYDMVWTSYSHNERVDVGANKQAKQVFGGGSSPGAPSATAYFQTIAVASASLTVAKSNQSLGSDSANATTNEFTTIGLSRAAAATLEAGDYTAPSTLDATFSQVLDKTFTATGSGTAYGAGLFDSTTVSGSILYVEANFSANATLITNDTLTVTITISN